MYVIFLCVFVREVSQIILSLREANECIVEDDHESMAQGEQDKHKISNDERLPGWKVF